eukprot:gene27431-34145_t
MSTFPSPFVSNPPLTSAVSTVGSNVEFILDGDAKPSGCMVGKWQPWKSVWIVGDNSEAFTSNAQENDMYRFAILNNPENVTNWEWMASPSVNYGKFSAGAYPYQLWEPDMQEDIQEYKDLYLSGPQHAGGYHFAINSDIAMFRVYSSSKGKYANTLNTPYGVNQPLDATQTKDTAGEKPHMVQLSDSSHFLSLYTSSKDHSTLYYVVLTVDIDAYTVSSSAPVALPQTVSSALKLSATSNVVKVLFVSGNLLVVSSTGSFISTAVTVSSSGVVTLSDSYLSGALSAGDVLDVTHTSNNEFLVLSRDALSTVSIATSGNKIATEVVSSQSLHAPVSSADMVSGGVSVVNSGGAQVVLVFISTADNVILGAELTPEKTTRWVQITAGRHFSLSSNSQDGMLSLHNDYGYCYNSHSHNTRATPLVCSSSPQPTQYTLDYSLGAAEEWVNMVRTSSCVVSSSATKGEESVTKSSTCFALNACHDSILHGSYDQGSSPEVVLTSLTKTDGTSKSFLLELHQGVSTSLSTASLNHAETPGFGGCGEPIHRDGVVVDSFQVDEWIQALKRVAKE